MLTHEKSYDPGRGSGGGSDQRPVWSSQKYILLKSSSIKKSTSTLSSQRDMFLTAPTCFLHKVSPDMSRSRTKLFSSVSDSISNWRSSGRSSDCLKCILYINHIYRTALLDLTLRGAWNQSRYCDQATRWTAEERPFDSRQVQDVFIFSEAFRPAVGPNPPSYSTCTGSSFAGIKWPKPKAHYTASKVKNNWSINSTPPYAFTAHTFTSI